MSELSKRIRAACVGHPNASIPWPHRILHEAADEIDSLNATLYAERKRREEAEEERNTALSALNTERTMREAAATALTEWHGGIKQGQRIIDAEAYKRLWKETKADNARLREALELYAARGNWIADAPHYYGASHYASKVEHDCGEIARAALNHEPEKEG